MQNVTTTTVPSDLKPVDNGLKFIVIPLVVILLVMLLSALVYLMARKKRQDLIRENILKLYDFDTNEEEWDSINSFDHASYSSLDYTTAV